MPWVTPNAIFDASPDAEIENEQRQDGDLRQPIEQEDNRHQALPRERLQTDRETDDKADDNRDGESDGKFEEGQA